MPSFFFIHTRAGCLGDTENGRNIQSVGRTVETWGGMGMNRAVLVSRGGNIKSKWRDERGETRHSYSTNRDCLGQVHQEHRNTASMHRQWKLTVRTEWHRTQTVLTVSGDELNASHRNKDSGRDVNSSSPNSHEDRQKPGIRQEVHTGEDPQIRVNSTTSILSHSAGGKFICF